jgi:hypothetical protein
MGDIWESVPPTDSERAYKPFKPSDADAEDDNTIEENVVKEVLPPTGVDAAGGSHCEDNLDEPLKKNGSREKESSVPEQGVGMKDDDAKEETDSVSTSTQSHSQSQSQSQSNLKKLNPTAATFIFEKKSPSPSPQPSVTGGRQGASSPRGSFQGRGRGSNRRPANARVPSANQPVPSTPAVSGDKEGEAGPKVEGQEGESAGPGPARGVVPGRGGLVGRGEPRGYVPPPPTKRVSLSRPFSNHIDRKGKIFLTHNLPLPLPLPFRSHRKNSPNKNSRRRWPV